MRTTEVRAARLAPYASAVNLMSSMRRYGVRCQRLYGCLPASLLCVFRTYVFFAGVTTRTARC